MNENALPDRFKKWLDPNLYNVNNAPPSGSLDSWPGDMPIFDKFKRNEVPHPFEVIQEIADKHMEIPIDGECERDGDTETARDKWHPVRPTLARLAKALAVTPQYFSAMMNDRAPVGLKFAKTLYTYCRKENFNTEAWRLRLAYEFWGAKGEHNPERNELGGARAVAYTGPKSEERKREIFERKQLNERLAFERKLAHERQNAPGLRRLGDSGGKFGSKMS